MTGDVQDPASATELISQTVTRLGQLDSFVVNAGIGMHGGILDATNDDLTTMVLANVEGTVWAVRAPAAQFLPRPGRRRRHGHRGVDASLRGGADEAVHAATKFAQVGLAGA